MKVLCVQSVRGLAVVGLQALRLRLLVKSDGQCIVVVQLLGARSKDPAGWGSDTNIEVFINNTSIYIASSL